MVDFKLVTLVTLCEEKSYVNTAKKLFITQPCVTHHIKALEKDYEITLFENKNFELTPKGKLLYNYAKNAIQEYNIVKKCLKEDYNTVVTTVAFTTTALDCIGINRIQKSLDETDSKLNVATYEYDTIIKKLESGEVDFAVIDTSYDSSKFSSIEILTTSIVLVVNPYGIYKEKERVTREQFLNSTLILSEESSGLYQTTYNSLYNKNIRLKNQSILHTNNLELMIDYVNRYDGIGIAYYDSVISYVKAGTLKFIDLLNYHPSHNLYLIYRNDNSLSDEAKNILKQIEDKR